MKELQQIIIGSVCLAIGIILLFKQNTFVRMAVESQKGVDRALGRESDHSGAKFDLIPKAIIIIIGVCFSIWGVYSIVSYL